MAQTYTLHNKRLRASDTHLPRLHLIICMINLSLHWFTQQITPVLLSLMKMTTTDTYIIIKVKTNESWPSILGLKFGHLFLTSLFLKLVVLCTTVHRCVEGLIHYLNS